MSHASNHANIEQGAHNIAVGVDEPVHQRKNSLQATEGDGKDGQSLASIWRVVGVVVLCQQLPTNCHAQWLCAQCHLMHAVMWLLAQQLAATAVCQEIAAWARLLRQGGSFQVVALGVVSQKLDKSQ